MKKLIISLGGIFSLGLSNFSSAGFIDFTSINQTLRNVFSPVLDFFHQVWDVISFSFSFLYDLISGLYYGFNTIISLVWKSIQDITGMSFFNDNSFVFSNISSLLGVSASLIFYVLFFCALSLVLIRFVYSLIPFFHQK